MAAAMQKGVTAQEELYDAVAVKLGKVLTARQKTSFGKLRGEEFDLTKLAVRSDRRQGGEDRPTEAEAADPAAAARNRSADLDP
jgi:hypothetical protein